MSDSIRVLGLLINARHGVRQEERTLTQPFEIDVVIERDLSKASKTDHIEDTVDYSAIVEIVKDVMHGNHCYLLERLAGCILDRIESMLDEGSITVRIRKPRAPINIPFSTMEVELSRTVQP